MVDRIPTHILTLSLYITILNTDHIHSTCSMVDPHPLLIIICSLLILLTLSMVIITVKRHHLLRTTMLVLAVVQVAVGVEVAALAWVPRVLDLAVALFLACIPPDMVVLEAMVDTCRKGMKMPLLWATRTARITTRKGLPWTSMILV